MKKRFWRIEIEEKTKIISSTIIHAGQITESKIEELLKVVYSKYILSDEEILATYARKNTKRYAGLIHYNRFQNRNQNNDIEITYLAQSSGISITIILVYENKLSNTEKKNINKYSCLNLK